MSYINRISVNNAESHDLFGLDTQIKVAYSDKAQGTKMTSLRNALFLHNNGDVKLGYILSGDSDGLGVNLDGSNSLLGYIEHCYDNNLTSKKVSATEQLSYTTIVNSPINITSGVLTFNNDNKSKQHAIKWGLLADAGMYLENLGSIYLFSGAEAIENDNESGFVLNQYKGTNESPYPDSHTMLEPKVASTGYLGTKEKRFFDIYTQNAHIDQLEFRKTTPDSIIYIDSANIDSPTRTYITTYFNLAQESSLTSSPAHIRWSMRALGSTDIDQSHALTMGVPNFFSIKPSGHNGGGETSVVFQSIGSDENGYHPAVFPEENNTGSLGQSLKRWGSLYVNNIVSDGVSVDTTLSTKILVCQESAYFGDSIECEKTLLVRDKITTEGSIIADVKANQSKFWDLDAHSIGVGGYHQAQSLDNGSIGCQKMVMTLHVREQGSAGYTWEPVSDEPVTLYLVRYAASTSYRLRCELKDGSAFEFAPA